MRRQSTNPKIRKSTAAVACVLYAEDEENDILFLELAFKRAGSPHTLKSVPDGEQAIAYLAGEGDFADREPYPLPALVVLDINMPRQTGLEVLQWIRRQPQFKSLPVIIVTSSSREEDKRKAHELGVDEYLLKPSDPLKLLEIVKLLHERWLSGSPAAIEG